MNPSMFVLSMAWWIAGAGQTPPAAPLPGFEESPHFREQVRRYDFDPDVHVEINAPAVDAFRPDRPVRVVVYALPNGNTIAQTVGRRMAPDLDWHFDIQHIGAQIRRVREVATDCNLVVAYVEADGRSWPRWRQEHADSGAHVARLIESLRAPFEGGSAAVELTSHSGGGSLIFGYLNQVEHVPDWIERIVFLDSNYGYDEALGHGDKLVAWLRASKRHRLGIIAYDDRNVQVNGKPVVGPTGGTYRRTRAMLGRLSGEFELTLAGGEQYEHYCGPGGQIDVILVANPDNAILHTVLVEKNGLIHALTFGTPWADQAGVFFAERAYDQWIQPF